MIPADSFNSQLANACQLCQAACCKKGKIFLPYEECERLRAHLAATSPAALAEFQARIEPHEGFVLYDQKDCCQFLDDRNLCTLHNIGLKPSECFWWPYHVYQSGSGSLQIELSNTCCDGWRHHDTVAAAAFLTDIDQKVNALGVATIEKFRAAYGGSYGRIPVRPVHLMEWRPITVAELPTYRKTGEKLFPNANWDLGIERYSALVPAFPEGLWAAWMGEQILGYVSLWPIKYKFADEFLAGAVSDDDLTANVIESQPSTQNQSWFLTVIALTVEYRPLRSMIRGLLVERLGHALAGRGNRIIAEAVTERGDRFLRRFGFRFPSTEHSARCVIERT